jgi:sortase A
MAVGDIVTVTTGEGVFHYRVEDVRRPGSRLPPPLRAGNSRLTLVTSASRGWRSGWAPSYTVYVDALLAGNAQPVPPGVSITVSAASLPMHNDTSAVAALLFWLEGFVFLAFAARWAWRRWGRFETWIVGAPVLLAVLWGTSDTFMRLLPNLL